MAQLVDSHCHLDFDKFDSDRDQVVAAAQGAGVVAIINPGTDLASSRAAVRLAEKYEIVYAAIGIHPHDATTFSAKTLSALRDLASHPKVVAVGEIGLDYHRNYSPPDVQRKAFAAQLELAAELNLPVIVHNRKASRDTFDMLDTWLSERRAPADRDGRREPCGVLHSYAAATDWLSRAIEHGFLIGISGPVTFPKAAALHQVAKAAPLERLLVETDAPFLTPVPCRGRRNEPAYVQYVAAAVADLRGVSIQQIGEQTTKNAFGLFPRDRKHS